MTHAVESPNGRAHRDGVLVLARPGEPATPPVGVLLPELVGRVLAAVAGRLADSVDAVAVRSGRARDAADPDLPSGGRVATVLTGPAARTVLDQLVRLLEWVQHQIRLLATLASRLVGRNDPG